VRQTIGVYVELLKRYISWDIRYNSKSKL